jgi:anti-sigma factor RsiW
MNVADDKLEILIGKLLDGELSPAEQRLLESELEHNSAARELLEQLRTLHVCSREAVACEILGAGTDPQEIFTQAWQQNKKSFWRQIVKADGHLHWGFHPRFAVGLAAGFLLGLTLHFALVWGSKPPADAPVRPPIARAVPTEEPEWDELRPAGEARNYGQITRNVDWYGFTDERGNQWLIEGMREGMVKPAAYDGDL